MLSLLYGFIYLLKYSNYIIIIIIYSLFIVILINIIQLWVYINIYIAYNPIKISL